MGAQMWRKKPAAQCLLRKYTFRTMIFMCWYRKVCKPVYRVFHDIVSRIHQFQKKENYFVFVSFYNNQPIINKYRLLELLKWQNSWIRETLSWRAYKYVTVVWHCDIILWQCVKKPDKIMIYYTLVVLFTVIIIYPYIYSSLYWNWKDFTNRIFLPK